MPHKPPVKGLSLLPKMYRICGIPRPLNRLAPQTPVEGLSLLQKMYRILWNFILRFWTRKILNSLRFAQGFALSSAQLELIYSVSFLSITFQLMEKNSREIWHEVQILLYHISTVLVHRFSKVGRSLIIVAFCSLYSIVGRSMSVRYI